ncbi:MAG: PTS sugar transporter subunit IIA [Pirellulales bacterium]|nr:PTS sugar transporter subunit IIA [Pirellulales bacterium]
MADEDFDISSLAEYLHLAPQQVSRLAERGKIPGRRSGGQWKFSSAEIHHWLEHRIGLSDESELAHVEGALERASGGEGADEISIVSMLPESAIAVPLDGKTRRSVISGMVELAAGTGLLWDPEKMAEAVAAREQMHPTALDNGVALMHPRRPMPTILGESFIALGLAPRGIPFGSERGKLTDVFFLICSYDDASHLRTLARLSRVVNDADFLAELRACESAGEVLTLVAKREQEVVT